MGGEKRRIQHRIENSVELKRCSTCKKWLEIDRLKPKEIVKKPYYHGDYMVWSDTKRKWYVVTPDGDWLEFVGKEEDIEWKTIK